MGHSPSSLGPAVAVAHSHAVINPTRIGPAEPVVARIFTLARARQGAYRARDAGEARCVDAARIRRRYKTSLSAFSTRPHSATGLASDRLPSRCSCARP